MDPVTRLLAEARAAGLELSTDGSELYVRGSKVHAGLVDQLRQHKAALIAALRGETAPEPPAAPERKEPAAPARATRRYISPIEAEVETFRRFILGG